MPRTITKKYEVFTFEELSKESKEKAISDHINFLIETMPIDSKFATENYKKAYKKSEDMQTPWFFGQYVYEHCKDDIINEIKVNEYDFFKNGKIAV